MKEALKLALEALERYQIKRQDFDRFADVITAIKEALAQPEQEPVSHAVIAGALFDFMGYLTSLKKRIVLSASDDAAPAVDAIRDFAEKRGLSLNDAQVREWIDALAQPEQKPVEDVVAYHSDGTKTVRIASKRPWGKPWVSLTDEEYDEIWRMDLNNKDIMDKTIAKLKEKNT